MWEFTANIGAFLVRRARVLFLIVSILVLAEGLLYIFFPQKIKKIIKDCPVPIFRLAGGLIVIIGVILILLYANIFMG